MCSGSFAIETGSRPGCGSQASRGPPALGEEKGRVWWQEQWIQEPVSVLDQGRRKEGRSGSKRRGLETEFWGREKRGTLHRYAHGFERLAYKQHINRKRGISRANSRFFPGIVAHRMVQRPPHVFLLCPASCLLPRLWNRPTELAAVESEVASMFMKAPRDFTRVSLARNVQRSYSNHPIPIPPYIFTAAGTITTNLVT